MRGNLCRHSKPLKTQCEIFAVWRHKASKTLLLLLHSSNTTLVLLQTCVPFVSDLSVALSSRSYTLKSKWLQIWIIKRRSHSSRIRKQLERALTVQLLSWELSVIMEVFINSTGNYCVIWFHWAPLPSVFVVWDLFYRRPEELWFKWKSLFYFNTSFSRKFVLAWKGFAEKIIRNKKSLCDLLVVEPSIHNKGHSFF